MRLPLSDLMALLGVPHTLSAYETYPWSVSDASTGQTCSAEVRMGPDGDDVEAEIQVMFDDPQPDQPQVQQLLWLRAVPHTAQVWMMTGFRLRGEAQGNELYDWETKSANLFRACVNDLQRGMIPDFDAHVEQEIRSKERFGDQRGGGSGKSPKIRAGQVLGLKRGQGF